MQSDLHVALVSIENRDFFRVVLFHHFHGETSDGGLEVGLLGVDHDADVEVGRGLHDGMQAGQHVAELFFFFCGQDVDHGFHASGFEVGHLEHFFHEHFGIDQSGPGKQVNQTAKNIVLARKFKLLHGV